MFLASAYTPRPRKHCLGQGICSRPEKDQEPKMKFFNGGWGGKERSDPHSMWRKGAARDGHQRHIGAQRGKRNQDFYQRLDDFGTNSSSPAAIVVLIVLLVPCPSFGVVGPTKPPGPISDHYWMNNEPCYTNLYVSFVDRFGVGLHWFDFVSECWIVVGGPWRE